MDPCNERFHVWLSEHLIDGPHKMTETCRNLHTSTPQKSSKVLYLQKQKNMNQTQQCWVPMIQQLLPTATVDTTTHSHSGESTTYHNATT